MIEILVFLPEGVTMDEAVRAAEKARNLLTHSGYSARITDIRGDEDEPPDEL